MAAPRITVLTPSYNQAHYLEATIRSVLEQGYPALEYMVLDGGSTDGSPDIIKGHADRLAFWASEPDGGQAAALNKGFSRATGDLLGWINSDDQLLPGSLAALAEAHERHPEAILCGDSVNFDDAGREKLMRVFGLTTRNLVDRWSGLAHFHQPGVYFPRKLWERVGPLDASLRFVFDLDWMCRALTNAEAVYLGRPIARFRVQADQKTTREYAPFMEELRKVASRYLDVFEQPELPRVRAQLDLDAAGAELLAGASRGATLRAVARAIRAHPRLALSPRVARVVAYSVAPRPVARLVERYRLHRHNLGGSA